MSELPEGGGLPDKEFNELLESIGAAAPLMKNLMHPSAESGTREAKDNTFARREALLCALKPYLSKERCDTVDYLLRLWRIGQTVKTIGGLYVHSTDV